MVAFYHRDVSHVWTRKIIKYPYITNPVTITNSITNYLLCKCKSNRRKSGTILCVCCVRAKVTLNLTLALSALLYYFCRPDFLPQNPLSPVSGRYGRFLGQKIHTCLYADGTAII